MTLLLRTTITVLLVAVLALAAWSTVQGWRGRPKRAQRRNPHG
ncbi:hypothetical protein [Actinoplanes subtropicus]|nr:hypothetical protein [Actinoplanes subtropicus]